MQNKKIRVLDFFAGIGAFDSALNRLGVDYELVDAIEIDKYAMQSFNAVHGTDFECQDICEWDKDVGEIDIMWQSSPCQSLSTAGKGHGADKGSGTRSSLVWEVVRIVEKVRPKIVIWENVKGLVSKKHKHNHTEYMNELEKLGYNSYWKVLNTKDFLIPQNRERCFTVSIRKDIDNGNFEFPESTLLVKRLKDILEPKVDEKYYISSKQLAGMARTKFNSYKLDNLLRDKDGEAKTLTARFDGCPQLIEQPLYQNAIDTAVEKGMVEPTDVIEYTYSRARTQEVENGYIRKQNQGDNSVMPTLKTNPQQLGVVVDEPMIAASRGRSKGDWNENEHYQQLEPRKDGLTNSITTATKDNYVVEPQPIKRRRTEYGKEVRKAYENHEIEANEAMRENYIASDGIMPTLTASKREQRIVVGDNEKPIEEMPAIIQKQGDRGTNNYSVNSDYAYTVPANPMSDRGQMVVEPNLKTKLCNELVEQGVVEGGEVINHSYTNSNQRKELKDYIENDNGVMPTLTTRPDIMGYVEKSHGVRYNVRHEKAKESTRKTLWVLREKIGDETFCEWGIGGLCRILAENILRQNLYAKSIFENWKKRTECIKCEDVGKIGEPAIFTENEMRDMWEKWQARCSSYRPQLSEQQFNEFENLVQKLSHETTSQKEFVQGLWETSEGIGLLQQALLEIQKIWESSNQLGETNIRIRKLTPREVWRLQGFHDDEFEKAEKVVSSAQAYKQAGNSCTVSVLAALMSQLDILGVKPWNEMSLKEREKIAY